MNKKSLWLKGDWFVSSWVAFYSALERRGVLIDKTPPSPPDTHPPSHPPSLVPVTPELSSTMHGTLSLEILEWKREGANLCCGCLQRWLFWGCGLTGIQRPLKKTPLIKTTVLALEVRAWIQRKRFCIDNKPTPQASTYHAPPFALSFIYRGLAVCSTIH